jgi:hypothetical protein
MGMHLKSSGSFKNLEKFLHRSPQSYFSELHDYGRQGVALLARATPSDTGKTASSWSYRLINARGRYGIEWYNSNVNDGEVIAILIQYGHGTGTGGYVQGIDYINPATQPLFNKMADEIWRKVTNA